MASRDRSEIVIKCPQCSEAARIGISENDYPYMKQSGLLIEYVEGNYDVSVQDKSFIKAVCKKCGTVVLPRKKLDN